METLKDMATVSIVGLGYVGLPLALQAAEVGHEVVGIDIDSAKIEKLRKGRTPVEDKRVHRQLENEEISVTYTDDIREVENSEIIILCVPTPVDESKQPDYSMLMNAARSIATHMSENTLIIVESTVAPGTLRREIVPIIEASGTFSIGENVYLAHCPERINPGDPTYHVGNISRVVGAFTAEGLSRTCLFMRTITTGEVLPLETVEEAEAVKVFENAHRDVNIAFVNEMAMLFDAMGINLSNVIKGASTKPFGFVPYKPGVGVGGHCIPVDPYLLIQRAVENGFNSKLLKTARDINSGMPSYAADKVIDALTEAGIEARDAVIAVLGISYKADLDDLRESPSIDLIKALEEKGVKTRVFDPHLLNYSTAGTIDEVLEGCDGVVIATPHTAFEKLSPKTLRNRGIRLIVDGRNEYERKIFEAEGLVYRGMGS